MATSRSVRQSRTSMDERHNDPVRLPGEPPALRPAELATSGDRERLSAELRRWARGFLRAPHGQAAGRASHRPLALGDDGQIPEELFERLLAEADHVPSTKELANIGRALYGHVPAHDAERFESTLGSALESGVIQDAVIAQSQNDVQAFWAIRDGIAEITTALTPYASLDVSMAVADMPDFLHRVDEELAARFGPVTNLVFGHVGDKNLHVFITTGRETDVGPILDAVYKITGG